MDVEWVMGDRTPKLEQRAWSSRRRENKRCRRRVREEST